MKLRLTPEAIGDLHAISDYLIGVSPDGARNVAAAIRHSIALLGEHPLGGRQTRNPRVRLKVVPRRPYKIFYRVEKSEVVVLHIRHTSRRDWVVDQL